MIDPVELAKALIACPSVTPADAGAQDVLAAALEGIGFTVHRLTFGAPPDGPVANLFATIGSGSPHFAFAGHTDVVPPGEGWDAFTPRVDDGWLTGRGAADMKGAIAAMAAAAERAVTRGFRGTLSLVITGDEEGPATFGTPPLLAWMEANGHVPDLCLVGEPTSSVTVGDTIKIGRRGSLNAWITVRGVQGHVAYPAQADNPVTRLVAILAELKGCVLDTGSAAFQPSNLEVTDIGVGNTATNVIPAQASARLNIRFNDRQRGADLEAWLRATVAAHAPDATVEVRITGEAFLTDGGPLPALVAAAVREVTGVEPVLSTTGGTSDARFIRRLCPVVELGLVGATMHQVGEQVRVDDLATLTDIYAAVLARASTT
ncbi:MAG: succinyl-diaminopimelate desuccinylase [Sphingomonadaceae bacterium]|nr:succinyl-diaminopimelate desuccinylase [Sphingomonadaceae bacterium]